MIVLLGYMGSGKTTVGQKVSAIINYDFIDLDAFIEEEEKMTVSEIFNEKGSIYFRKKENSCLMNLISQNKKVVLSLGGGTPCYYNHMKLLNNNRDIHSFYLNASIPKLTERLWIHKATRPIIAGVESQELLMEFIAKHLFERRPFYQLAQHHINVDDKEISEITREIIGKLF